jgi:hypothetical protein
MLWQERMQMNQKRHRVNSLIGRLSILPLVKIPSVVLLFVVVLIVFLQFIFVDKSHANTGAGQAHFRQGFYNATFKGNGDANGSFTLNRVLDFEYENIISNRQTFLVRGILGVEVETAQVKYAFGGIGQRYYFSSNALQWKVMEDGLMMSYLPRLSFYLGWDFGIAQVQVVNYGPVLSAYSTLIEYGGSGGFIYNIYKTIGLEGQLGMSYGNGFSSVAVTSQIVKMYIGLSMYF